MDERTRTERDYWERRAAAWDRRVGAIERFSESLGHAAMDALGPLTGAQVLDVGCGPGSTTLDLGGRVGPGGKVTGLDIAPSMVAAAERRAADSGVANVGFVVHDLGEAPLPGGYDAAFSRFGVMFFARREIAFANLVGSLGPGGRFACVVWAPIEANPWMSVPTLSALGVLQAPLNLPAPGEPGPFSLSDPDELAGLLEAAGLTAVDVGERHGRVELRSAAGEAEADVASMLEVGPLGDAFGAADPATRAEAVAAVLAAAEPYRTVDGWELPGTALVASGRRAP
jgi:SAM-dependent methyltransferase